MFRPFPPGSPAGSLAAALLIAALAAPAAADVTPAPIFGDHMVLQAGREVPIFGTTEPGGTVGVSVNGVGGEPVAGVRPVTTLADDRGRWSVNVGPFPAGTTLSLSIGDPGDDAADIEFADVLVGDVWLCSGQSNMEWKLADTLDGDRAIRAAEDDSIRLFTVPRHSAREPRIGLKGRPGRGEPTNARWVKLSPEAAASFSAVGYYFGRAIHEATGRPVGLIDSSWGGTPAEAWTREETLKDLKTTPPLLERWERYDADFAAGRAAEGNWAGQYGPEHPHHPANLNNGMIAPLAPFALKGAIWYQGESNAGRAEQYRELFPAMIEDWRDQFGQELPFFWVQLANFKARRDEPGDSEWAELREAQDNTLDELPNVGQAVILDVGEEKDIHPRNKRDVGERLALAALRVAYGQEGPGMLSPRFEEVKLEGTTATVTFDMDGDRLQVRRDGLAGVGPNEAPGFAAAGPDGPFLRARAELTGPDTVRVTAPAGVGEITAVRYGWADNPRVGLFNTRGLPAAPFRTDARPGVTAGKY